VRTRHKTAPHSCTNGCVSGTLKSYEALCGTKRRYATRPSRAAAQSGRELTGGGVVLSIGKLTVEQSRYYERQVAQGRDDYYAGRGESPGRWTGRGSQVLNVAGDVDKAGFAALMEGRHPGTGERLKRVGGRSKVAAFDLTF
jgi:hypothetical protein